MKEIQLNSRFVEAIDFAFNLHKAQTRKVSGTPYFSHLLSVAALVLEAGGNEDLAIAALLHDAIEDQGGTNTRVEIEQRFGATIEALVIGCSDHIDGPKLPWKERKQQFIHSLNHAHLDVLKIVAADKLHNVRSLLSDYEIHRDRLWDLFKGKREGTLWNYQAITVILGERIPEDSNVQQLQKAVVQLERLR